MSESKVYAKKTSRLAFRGEGARKKRVRGIVGGKAHLFCLFPRSFSLTQPNRFAMVGVVKAGDGQGARQAQSVYGLRNLSDIDQSPLGFKRLSANW